MKIVLVLLLLGIFANSAGADNSGRLIGKIGIDSSSVPLAGARVALNDTQLSCVTDSNGHYQIEGIYPEKYDLTISHPDINPVTFFNIQVSKDSTTIFDVNFQSLKMTYQNESDSANITQQKLSRVPPPIPHMKPSWRVDPGCIIVPDLSIDPHISIDMGPKKRPWFRKYHPFRKR